MTSHFLIRSLDRGAVAFMVVVAAIAVLVPFLNLAVPASSAFHLPTYLVALFGKYACYALLGAVDRSDLGLLRHPFAGPRRIFRARRLRHGHVSDAPDRYPRRLRQSDFARLHGVPELDGIADLLVRISAFPLRGGDGFCSCPARSPSCSAGSRFAAASPAFTLSIITQALTYALMLGFFRNNFGFGGNNGLTDFKDILGFNVQAETTRNVLFSTSCIALILAFLLCRAIIGSKFGKVLLAIRDAKSRTRFLGYRVESYKLFVFTLSACMAGLAGALYVPQVGIINPGEFAPANSIEAVIWVAVGGRGTLIGAALGAVVVNYAKTFFTSGPLAPYWLFLLGSLFVLVTLLLPRGIVGTLRHWTALKRDRDSAAAEDGVTEPLPAE